MIGMARQNLRSVTMSELSGELQLLIFLQLYLTNRHFELKYMLSILNRNFRILQRVF